MGLLLNLIIECQFYRVKCFYVPWKLCCMGSFVRKVDSAILRKGIFCKQEEVKDNVLNSEVSLSMQDHH